jgi:hypothetical protein
VTNGKKGSNRKSNLGIKENNEKLKQRKINNENK